MSWNFYSKEGNLLYGVTSTASGNADTLDSIDSSGFVQITDTPGVNVGNVNLLGRLALPLVTTSADLTVVSGTHRTVLVDTGIGAGAAIEVTLPATPIAGEVYEVRDVGNSGAGNASNKNITLVRDNVAHSIDGVAADLTILEDGKGVTLIFDGTNWVTLADRLNVASIDAGTLDGIDSTQFLRSDAADIAVGSITFSDITNFSKSTYSPVVTISSDTTLDDSYRTVLVNPDSSAVVVTLPASPSAGQWYEIKDVGNGGLGSAGSPNLITIDPNGNSINGSVGSLVLDSLQASATVVSDGVNWFVLSEMDSATAGPTSLNDLSDVTTAGSYDGALLRYNNGTPTWEVATDLEVDGVGGLHLKNNASSAGVIIGENAGVGNEATVAWSDDKTLQLSSRVITNGTPNSKITVLENSVVPVVSDAYTVQLPTDNLLVAKTLSGDLFITLPSSAVSPSPKNGDTITLKDIEGNAGVVSLAFIAEGVRRRNVPVLSLSSVTGTIAGPPTTTTPGGVGVDEQQNILVTGSGTFELTFDGSETAATLTELSTALDVETALNALSPHPIYGNFSVSCTGTDVSTGGGVTVTFDGGTLVDGEATFYLGIPYEVAKVVYYGGNWFLI